MIIHNPILTGSFTVNGTDVASITSSAASITAINAYTASQDILNGTYTLTSSFAAQTASFTAFTSSVNTFTASQLVLNGTYATTSSNTFTGIQTVNSNLVVTGSITAQTLVVQTITSSVDFVTGSTRFGSLLANTHVFTGSLLVSGSGFVGIGTNSPIYSTTLFSAYGSGSDVDVDIKNNTSAGAANFYLRSQTDGTGEIRFTRNSDNSIQGRIQFNQTNGSMAFRTGGNDNKLFISGSGNVGIGTSSPGALLHIYDSTAGSTKTYTKYSALEGGDIRVGKDSGVNNNAMFGAWSNNATVFYTNSTERMRITEAGLVGIGTASPSYKFTVLHAVEEWASKFSNSNGTESVDVFIAYGAGNGIAIDSSENDSTYVFKAMAGTGGGGGKGSVPILYAQCNGNVGLGTSSPSYRLQLSTDSAAKPSTNTWTISSDIRVKENINPYTKGLETILKINPVTYDYNGKAGFTKGYGGIGIIAQDVLNILPESISTYHKKLEDTDENETELYNFNSHALTYIIINAIQELQAQITELKNK